MNYPLLTTLKAAGFTGLAAALERRLTLYKRLKIAYTDYAYLSKEVYSLHKGISWVPVDIYYAEPWGGYPPTSALNACILAKDRGCFTNLICAHCLWKMVGQEVREDPGTMIVGQVEGCEDYFVITAWERGRTLDEMTSEALNDSKEVSKCSGMSG